MAKPVSLYEMKMNSIKMHKVSSFDKLLGPDTSLRQHPLIKSFQNSVEGIQGATPDTYGRLWNIHGQDYMNNVKSIDGATPPQHKDFSHKMSFNLYTKDATG